MDCKRGSQKFTLIWALEVLFWQEMEWDGQAVWEYERHTEPLEGQAIDLSVCSKTGQEV